jgi:hypothetical protein
MGEVCANMCTRGITGLGIGVLYTYEEDAWEQLLMYMV